jgi:hypothetical protein
MTPSFGLSFLGPCAWLYLAAKPSSCLHQHVGHDIGSLLQVLWSCVMR